MRAALSLVDEVRSNADQRFLLPLVLSTCLVLYSEVRVKEFRVRRTFLKFFF